MKLSELPADVLDHILQHEISHCAIELWKCGDRVLNQRLARGGVTAIKLSDPNSYSTSRWPRMLEKLLQLRSLSVHRESIRLDDVDTIRSSLLKMSPNLESLQLCFGMSIEVIMEPLLSEDYIQYLFIDDSNDGSSPSIPTTFISDSTARKMLPIANIFPKLKKLDIAGEPQDYTPMTNLDSLPDSLTSLHIRFCSHWDIFDASILPRGLQTLELGKMMVLTTNEAVASLPPSLTDLPGSVRLPSTSEAVNMLPPSLTNIGCFTHFRAPAATIFVPPSLLSLKFLYNINLTEEWFSIQLPPHLTTLMLPTHMEATVTGKLLSSFPHTLTYLRLSDSIDWSSITSEDFPRALHTLWSTADHSMGPQHLCLLPPQLASFICFISLGSWDKHGLEDLPPSLTSLDLTSFIPELTANAPLPRGLQSFRAPGAPSSIEATTRLVSFLPPSIKLLEWPRWPLLSKPLLEMLSSTERFPHLESFGIGSWSETRDKPASSELFIVFPRSLSSLNIHGSLVSSIFMEHIADLPPSLTYLMIRQTWMASDEKKSGRWIHLLPRTLRIIYCPYMSFHGEEIEYLPKDLCNLSLGPIREPKGEYFRKLPKKLTYLNISIAVDAIDPLHPISHEDFHDRLIDVSLGPSSHIWLKKRRKRDSERGLPILTPDPRVRDRFNTE
jgi:hypothetical protein